jgi:putative nucleotidyltransferase with HDIG domain
MTSRQENMRMTLLDVADPNRTNSEPRQVSLLEDHVGFKLETILLQVLKSRDSYTQEHSVRVVQLAEMIGHQLGLDTQQMDVLSLAASFHDIGKIGIPDDILLKPSSLTHEEYDIIKKHPTIAANMLRSLENPVLNEVAGYVLHHHEHWDGKGYPDGLSGESIPVISRIIAVVDALDAMTTTRGYRNKMNKKAALEMMIRETGRQFCPKVIASLLKIGHIY